MITAVIQTFGVHTSRVVLISMASLAQRLAVCVVVACVPQRRLKCQLKSVIRTHQLRHPQLPHPPLHPRQGCMALIRFYEGAGGPNWLRKTDWCSDLSHCQWEGVTCSLGTEIVVDLDVSGNRVSGTISESLSSLGALERLVTYANSLSGTMSEGVSSLSALQLHCSGCRHLPTEYLGR